MNILNAPLRPVTALPDPGPDDSSAANLSDVSTRALQGAAFDFEHFATANEGALANPSTMRTDPFGAASDATSDCIKACAINGAIASGVGAAYFGAIPEVPAAIAKGFSYGGVLGAVICDFPDTPSTPEVDQGAGGAPGSEPGQGGVGGASGDSAEPTYPPAVDDQGAVGGFETKDGAKESNAGKTKTETKNSTESEPANTPSEPASTDDGGTCSDSSSSSCDATENGRVDSSNGTGNMPADDAGYGSVNPRIANFGSLSAAELAVEASRLANDQLGSTGKITWTVGLGLTLRA